MSFLKRTIFGFFLLLKNLNCIPSELYPLGAAAKCIQYIYIYIYGHFSLMVSLQAFGGTLGRHRQTISKNACHGLNFWPIFAKFQCASFLIQKNVEKLLHVRTKTQKCCFSWRNLWEARCLIPKLEKTNVPM